ncbi:MAG: acyl-ACP--UDP-N-acetylglucosamine O-acyltransferase [Gammaproteobacteria bacterium]
MSSKQQSAEVYPSAQLGNIAELRAKRAHTSLIDKRADIHPEAVISENVTIGPWTVIGADVEIGQDCHIGPHVVIEGPTRIGKNNRISQFASLGGSPQDLTYNDEETTLEIGDHNIIREFCTLSRGTTKGGGGTRVGSHNFFMAYSHIGHDCTVGDHTILTNYAALSGHVVVEDYAKIAAYSGVHQFCVIGAHSFVAGATYVGKDVLPYLLVSGNTASVCGLNTVGLKREGFTTEVLENLRRAYRIIFRQSLTVQEAIVKLLEMVPECSQVRPLIQALRNSERGILR